MPDYRIAPLDEASWPAYRALIEKHNGIFGGCWCLWFHPLEDHRGIDGPTVKQRLIELGRAHAAVVLTGDTAVGWAQYGSPTELPRIYHRKEYEAEISDPADYRITCFFVDRDHRKSGVASTALAGALRLIAAAGGGSVEGYPRVDLGEKKLSSSFLFNGTMSMFTEAGFEFVRPLGKLRSIVRRTVAAG